jgi:VacB/RNase II family 3'-5' exoribonuclease
VPTPPVRLDPAIDARLGDGFDRIRAETGLPPAFPVEVLAEADEAARRGPAIPAEADHRHLPFVTVDPPGSRDLDQALHLERRAGGYLVRYAIADVAAFVAPGGALDGEARRRGLTVYLPDGRTPLHPPVLSEGAASLLPGVDRPALVWEVGLDADGRTEAVHLVRSTVRSRAQHTYEEVQAAVDAGTAEEPLALLAEVGRLRQANERRRGGVSLPLPEQRVVTDDGGYRLEYRSPAVAEDWGAQISLLVGMAAAGLMLDAGIGLLRTLPSPDEATLAVLARHARALDVSWPDGTAYPDVIHGLDLRRPTHAALAAQAARLFRGAGYLAFDGAAPGPSQAGHAAVAAPYAHVTAPLRRLADRFANEVLLAVIADREPPAWAREALPDLPSLMGAARQREGRADAAALDLVEAAVLSARVGDVLEAVVVDVADGGVRVQLVEPAVVARLSAPAPLGAAVRVRVAGADVASRTVSLELVD